MEFWSEISHAIFKWLHIIAWITWIGLLYFFNFINGHLTATYDAESKKKVVPELMPRALYWFRWGAAWTWYTGVILLYVIFWNGGLSMEATSETSMMVDVDFLVLAVRNLYKGRNDYEKISHWLETLYLTNRIKLDLKGILLVVY